MIETTIDLDLLDEGEENPFDKIMSAYERAIINSPSPIGRDFEKKILHLERKLQDICELQNEESNILYLRSKEILSAYTMVIENDHSITSINLIRESLDYLTNALSNKYSSIGDINDQFDTLSPLKFLKNYNIRYATVDQIKQATISSITSYNLSKTSFVENLHKDLPNSQAIDSWDINLSFQTGKADTHRPLELIHLIVEILNKIEGVEVVLEDIRIGSIIAKIKLYFKSEKAKGDTKEILDTARKFAKGKMEKEFEETEKIKAERDKLTVESEILQNQIVESNSIESTFLKSLQIQNSEEDLKKKKLENALLELKVLREKKEAYAEMLAAGFISQSQFDILIKGLPFLSIEGGRLKIGENIQIIDDL